MIQLEYLKEVIIDLEKFLQDFGGEVISCTQAEVDALESMLSSSLRLPVAYKEFLLYGGKKIGNLFEGGFSFSYKIAQNWLKYEYRAEILDMLRSEDPDAELPPDVFILQEHIGSNFSYFRLNEGDDPPVYFWEEGEGGLEVALTKHNSFSQFLMNEIRIRRIEIIGHLTIKKLEAGQPPRGRQLWYPTHQERAEGVVIPDLMRYLGFYTFNDLDKASDLCELDPNKYMEELSGWQCHSDVQERSQTRFFSPNV